MNKSITVILLLGLLLICSARQQWFDRLDVSWLRQLVANVDMTDFDFRRSRVRKVSGNPEPSDRQRERLQESLLSQIPLVMWRKDLSGKYTWVNGNFCQSIGRQRNEIIGKRDSDMFPRALAKKYGSGDRTALLEGHYEDSHEPYCPYGSSEQRYIHVVKKAVRDEAGKIIGTQGVFFDVTSDKYRALLDQAPVGFHELDKEGRFVNVNATELSMLGYCRSEVEGQPFADFVIEPDKEIITTVQKAVQSGKALQAAERDQVPVNLLCKNQTTLPALMTIRLITSFDGKPRGLLCVVNKVSDRLEIEETLSRPDEEYLREIRNLTLPDFCLDQELRTTFANDEYRVREQIDPKNRTSTEIFGQRHGIHYDLDNSRVLKDGVVLDKIELPRDGLRKSERRSFGYSSFRFALPAVW